MMNHRLFFLLLIMQALLFGEDAIGKVLYTEGSVVARTEQNERALSAASSIFLKDLIVLGQSARAQIRFTDGGIINLIPNTQFRVNTYKYREIFKKDESSSELLQGGFRVLSGAIAKKNPAGYEIKTPSAIIGLRGTIVEALLMGNRLTVGIEKGRAEIFNEAGSIFIGQGEEAQFASIPGQNIAPILQIERPPELNPTLFTPPQNSLSIDQIQQEQLEPKTSKKRARRGAQQQSSSSSTGSSKSSTSTPSSTGTTTGGTSTEGSSADDFDYPSTGSGASIQGGC